MPAMRPSTPVDFAHTRPWASFTKDQVTRQNHNSLATFRDPLSNGACYLLARPPDYSTSILCTEATSPCGHDAYSVASSHSPVLTVDTSYLPLPWSLHQHHHSCSLPCQCEIAHRHGRSIQGLSRGHAGTASAGTIMILASWPAITAAISKKPKHGWLAEELRLHWHCPAQVRRHPCRWLAQGETLFGRPLQRPKDPVSSISGLCFSFYHASFMPHIGLFALRRKFNLFDAHDSAASILLCSKPTTQDVHSCRLSGVESAEDLHRWPRSILTLLGQQCVKWGRVKSPPPSSYH